MLHVQTARVLVFCCPKAGNSFSAAIRFGLPERDIQAGRGLGRHRQALHTRSLVSLKHLVRGCLDTLKGGHIASCLVPGIP